jgi:3-deoxy-D-manno-octulosonate 8-phosphate phosphatase (KDO 8-P phosphatase)
LTALPESLRRLRMLILDVDGTQTDGYVYYGPSAGPLKRFHVRDGQGVTNIQRRGVMVAFISGDVSEATTLRARRLSVEECLQGVEDKASVVRGLLAQYKVAPDEAAYMGDEAGDIPAMDQVGLAIAPGDAVQEVRARADWVTEAAGGSGAVREVCDAIAAARSADE